CSNIRVPPKPWPLWPVLQLLIQESSGEGVGMAQDRKVFVGGVPQDLNQDDLYAIFSEHAGVKKAWLQKCRTTDETGNSANGQQNHRGFGFVIFHDALAIDELLGSAPSRFIVLRNGTKLEVKRALSSNKMSSPQADAADVSRARAQPPLHMSGPPRVLTPNARGARGVQADWAANRVANGDILRQLSLMQSGGYPLPQAPAPGLTAPAFASPYVAPTSAPPMMRPGDLPSARTVPEGRNVPLRNAIMQFYNEHRPEKLTEVDFIDFICNVYEGREEELDEALRVKYGTGLQLPRMTSMPQSTAADLGRSLEPSYVQEAWLPPQHLDPARLQLQQIQFELMNGKSLNQRMGRTWDPADYSSTTPTTGTGSLSMSNYSCSLEGASRSPLDLQPSKVDAEAPDFSWIDQIVGEDGFEVSDEVKKAIVGKSATKHRTELLKQAVVW
ncbi:unnamed protein product, partial [Durusdinium trenchii]